MLNLFQRWRKRQQQSPDLLSQADYDNLVRGLACQANQGASWQQILTTLQNRGLTPEQLAEWMTKYGGHWVQQPEPEFGQGLLRLSKVAEGSLAEIVKTMGQAIIQGPSVPLLSLETLATSKPSDSSASSQKLEQSSVPEIDPTVLEEIEAYLQGDFSFADVNPAPSARQSFTQEIPAIQPQPTLKVASTGQPESISPKPTFQPHSLTAHDWFDQGNKLRDLERYEDALDSYNQAIYCQPDFFMAWSLRGFTLSALERYEDALNSYNKAIYHQPDCAYAWLLRGTALLKLRRYDEALSSCEHGLSLQPDDAGVLSTGLFCRGQALLQLGRYDEALSSYNDGLYLQSGDASAWFNRGNILGNLGRNDEALDSYNQVISLQPDNASAWFNRGNILGNLGRNDEALDSYNQVISLQPDNASAWYNRGICLRQLECYEDALASYDQAISLHASLTEAWINRGAALNKMGRCEEALASFNQAIFFQPGLTEAWINRGSTLVELGRYEDALASLEQAISHQSDFAKSWDGRGIAIARLAHYQPDDEQLFNLKIKQELDSRSNYALSSFSNRDVESILKSVLKSLEQSKRRLLQTYVDSNNPQLIALIQRPPSQELEAVIAGTIPDELRGIVQQPVPAEVLQKITDGAARHPSRFRPKLRVGGYQGELNSYQAELGEYSQDEHKKAICKDTHPEGWGTLHCAIGKAHYFEGRKQASPWSYWRKAANSFKRALETLQPPQFEQLYFETLQDLIRALLSIGETQEVETLQQEATDYIRRVLAEADRHHRDQQQLGIWLAKFDQLTVDAAIQARSFPQALSTAETAKNVCLRWLLDLDEVPDVTFAEMQALVDEHTAMVYWHLSPAALTTFLLLPGASEPMVITPPDLLVEPAQTLANDERPLGLKQIVSWEDWLSQWNQDYENYSSAQSKTDRTVELSAWRRSHPWRTQMVNRLESLGQLLSVEAIHEALRDYPIQRLRLIPHRDLHRLPLHTFFDMYDCTYLPSAKVGLDRLPQSEPSVYRDLLIAENPQSAATDKAPTQKLAELPFAEVEAELIRQQFREANGEQPGRITTLENNQVPYDRLLSALGLAHNVFHFTGHGHYNSRSPAQSCLFLTGGDRLTLADIVNPNPELSYSDLSAYQLVFLAACETGVAGNQTITDDYVGLVSAFLKANASCVVSTLWRIESGSSLIFVSQFYQALLAGDPPAQALHKAQDFLKTATYEHIRTTFQDYIALIDRSQLHPDRKASLQLVLDYQLRYLESKQQANSTMEANSPSMPLYSHPYHWAAYTVSGL